MEGPVYVAFILDVFAQQVLRCSVPGTKVVELVDPRPAPVPQRDGHLPAVLNVASVASDDAGRSV